MILNLQENEAQYPNPDGGGQAFDKRSQRLQFIALVQVHAGKLGDHPEIRIIGMGWAVERVPSDITAAFACKAPE